MVLMMVLMMRGRPSDRESADAARIARLEREIEVLRAEDRATDESRTERAQKH